jgi:pyridoxamine 5'-phosphate oxidase
LSISAADIANLRQDYTMAVLDEGTVGNNPLEFFMKWFDEAHRSQIYDVNAMTLSTVDSAGRPHGRIVLLKGLEKECFTFFTNYNSAKGQDMATNAHVSLLFFWKELERQVRIDGTVSKLPDLENDKYFHSRPHGSRLGAWASPQSQVIDGREVLEENFAAVKQQYAGTEPPRPPHWGGYAVQPTSIEFWQGRSSRLHDRILFTKNEAELWAKCRLAP